MASNSSSSRGVIYRILLTLLCLNISLSFLSEYQFLFRSIPRSQDKILQRFFESSRTDVVMGPGSRRSSMHSRGIPSSSLKAVPSSSSSVNQTTSSQSPTPTSKLFIAKLKKFTDKKMPISNSDRKRLFHSVLHWIPELSPSETAQLIWCVGTLKLSSQNFEEMVAISDMLYDRLSMIRHRLSSEDMAISLIGFARMGVKFSVTSSVSFLDLLPQTLKHMDNQQLANSVWSLGKLGLAWNSLPLKCQKAMSEAITLNCKKMAPQGVANTIQGTPRQ